MGRESEDGSTFEYLSIQTLEGWQWERRKTLGKGLFDPLFSESPK
jgi:hypothetical protein